MLPDAPFDQARFFYLILLGVFVLVWLFARYRGRLGQAAQHAAIWVLIFIGVVLAIGFWGDMQRMLQGGPQRIDKDTIALARQADGHFHAIVEINGRNVPFIVDTGATNMVLSQRDAERVGIDPGELRFSIPTMTANGQTYSASVRLDRVALAGIVDTDVPATVNGGELGISLLGMRYLERFSSWYVEGDTMYLSR